METLRRVFEEFNNYQVQNMWLIFLIIFAVIFTILLFNYRHLLKSKLMDKILLIHGFAEKKDGDSHKNIHFHNTDLIEGNFKLEKRLFVDGFKWIGKHYLFIPNGKINTLSKKWNKLTIWYNGYNSKSTTYKIKRLPKDWLEKKLSKSQITDYEGTFIMGNLMVRTSNLSSLRIDSKNRKEFRLTYLFDNGSERKITVSTPEFFETTIGGIIPYNITFLDQCEVIELR